MVQYSKKRTGKKINYDSQAAASNTYNDYAGGQKNLSIGPVLQPVRTGASWSTDASASPIELPAGSQIAIYNTSSTVGVIRFGRDNTVISGTIGSFDTDGSPSIPCKGQDWTHLCCGERTFVKTSANSLIIYVIQDDTVLK